MTATANYSRRKPTDICIFVEASTHNTWDSFHVDAVCVNPLLSYVISAAPAVSFEMSLELQFPFILPAVVYHKCRNAAQLVRNVAQLVEHRTGSPPTQVRFPGAVRDFSSRDNFQCRLSDGVREPPSVIACVYVCAHVKDPVVHVRVRWIMETLKRQACTVGWVTRLCRSWLSPRKATRISHGSNSIGTIQL